MRRAALMICAVLAGPVFAEGNAARFSAAVEQARRGEVALAAQGFRDLAVLDHTGAQINLAVMTARGMGLPQDDLTAAYWAWRARLAGDRRAVELADHLRLQLDPALTVVLAQRLQDDLTVLADAGDLAALLALGVIAADLDSPARPVDAYVWFAIAAAFEVPKAALLRDLLAAELDQTGRRAAQEQAQTAFRDYCARLPADARIATCPTDSGSDGVF